jgi:glutathione S-transferase
VLRPAALRGQPAPLTAALTHLAGALAGSDYLAGTTLTVADAAVYATLLPLTAASSAVRIPQGGLVESEPADSPPCAGHIMGLAGARVLPRR